MYKVKVFVTLRESVLDPQGKAVQQSLANLGYEGVQDVRIGKYMELTVDGNSQEVEKTVNEVCEKLLSNPVIEDYRYEIEESVQQ
ncbi:phosphoribosylformylglycinamidine synthase subunit PurS [Bacillus sp. PK3_68]|uniref:phosphoribosylformylglycinamidine synthase subunit PurS n=1 Tax=Bacillaceae TaxID=186817 RepID=UPI000E7509C5|nr:phosphoribosylformylglycinamidine synthase subunit PurS [Bacillus sp. PK3_68]RJS61397.1 phosphoribosylformylglycinamidine synthase subunit PurS [Bacillus sp. PK3_68]